MFGFKSTPNWTRLIAIAVIAQLSVHAQSGAAAGKTLFSAKNNGRSIAVLQVCKKPLAIAFKAGMNIDADGAPDAYAPGNKGIDDIVYAGHEGNWWALVTDNNRPDGHPLVRNGYFVSMTSLENDKKRLDDPARYVNARKIPYFVLPVSFKKKAGVRLGDLGIVVNRENGKWSEATFADEGPEGLLGEGSMALAGRLGIDPNPRTGGTDSGVVYIVFPGAGAGRLLPQSQVRARATQLLREAGGLKRIVSIVR